MRRRRRLSTAKRYGIPVTALPQTIVDVVALPCYGLDDVVGLITRAVSEQRTTLEELRDELFHRDRQLADRARDRQGVGEGEATLRAGWVEVTQAPCALAADVAVAQLARGWTGWPTPCGPDCVLPRDQRLRRAG